MKVLIVGTGSVGSVIAQHLTEEKSIESLSLADKDVSRAKDLERRSRNNKVEVLKLDASNTEELKEAIRGKDIVMNACHPMFNEPIMKSCLRLGINYVDNANWNIMDQLAQNEKWKEARLLAVVGLGEDPGLSNVYAKYGADKLETVDEIRIRDGEYSHNSKGISIAPLFAPRVFFEEITTSAIVYADGKIRKLPMLSGKEVYEFQQPIGKQTVYNMDHEEVRTLPIYVGKEVRYVDFKLALSDDFVAILNALMAAGMLSKKRVKVDGVEVSPFDVFLSTIPNPMAVARGTRGHAGLAVEVKGTSDEKSVAFLLGTQMSHEEAYRRCRSNATSFLTGIVPAVFISSFAQGRLEQRGVMPPEALNAETIIGELTKVGVTTSVTRIEEETYKPRLRVAAK